MCRICSRRSGMVLLGHSVGMDTKPTSAVVVVPTAHLTTRRIGVRSSLRLLHLRLHYVTPLSDVGPPRAVRGSRFSHRIIHLPPPHPRLPPGCCGQLYHRYDDLSRLIPRPGAARRGLADTSPTALRQPVGPASALHLRPGIHHRPHRPAPCSGRYRRPAGPPI